MIVTNTLLSIGFSIIAAFTNVVQIPGNAVPTETTGLQKYVIGGPPPIPPTYLYLVARRGTEFWIRDGTVEMFSCPGSYKGLQKPEAIPNFQGTPTYSSNQVLELATKTIQRLVKSRNPIAGISPVVQIAGAPGDKLPFYWIGWPDTNINNRFKYSAFMEIDARQGLVTYLHLVDEGFFDYAFAQKIIDQVYTPERESVPSSRWELQHKAPLKRVVPYPTTNEVVRAIGSWLWLCQKLGVNTGGETNVVSVFWPRTALCTNDYISTAAPVCQVQFNNGAGFSSINGVVFSYYSPDACFVGFWQEMTREERERFKGKVLKHWEDLAKDLERVLVEKVGIPHQLLAPYSADTEINKPEFGTETTKRVVVGWRNWPRNTQRIVYVDETKLAFSAEFDVETGELKWISFHDPIFIAALRQAQANTK